MVKGRAFGVAFCVVVAAIAVSACNQGRSGGATEKSTTTREALQGSDDHHDDDHGDRGGSRGDDDRECRDDDVDADVRYDGTDHGHDCHDASRSWGRPFAVVIPSSIPVTHGNAGNGAATLTLWSGASSTQCSYKGGSSSAHPGTEQDRAAGRRYVFVSCAGGWRAGSRFSATRMTLHVERGDDQDPEHVTGVRLHLSDDDRACQPHDAGADAKPDASSDAGTDASTCTAAPCNDNNPCTVDSCGANGACVHTSAANGSACDDGNACTQSDSCQSGACVGASPVVCAAADSCHAVGTCNSATGVCSNPVAADGTACASDGIACTTDACVAGSCSHALAPGSCLIGSACVAAGAPNPANACQSCQPTISTSGWSNAANGSTCDDGNACTQSDSCQSGACVGASPVVCAAADQCHGAGACNSATGLCSNPAAADGTACASDGIACTTDACVAGSCSHALAAGSCLIGSACVPAGAPNPANACQSCQPTISTSAWSNAANGAACDDGNACTQTDSCQSGACVGANPLSCAADACHSAGTCDPARGCVNVVAAQDGTPCAGADKCNQVYQCTAGTCTGSSPVTCTPSDQCHLAGACDPATGSCSNPTAADGASCDDGSACTQTDACRSGTCTGSNPVICAALDACHVTGVCNAATGVCSNPNATNGTLCGTPSLSQACTAGACVAEPVCTGSETLCKGVCVSTSSDASNCGGCGAACASGSSCVLGACVAGNVMSSCGVPSGSTSVLASPEGVSAYLPNGSWTGPATGVQRIVLEGTALISQTIETPTAVNSCASNAVTGETVCVGNGTEVYIIHGTTIVATLTSGATGFAQFSGGTCLNCGVAIDAARNKAVIEVGLALPDGPDEAGYQFLDLATRTFAPPVPVAVDPTQPPATDRVISENVAVDSIRHLVLSPNEYGDYQLFNYGGGAPASFNRTFPASIPNHVVADFDSAAEDCTTGIALAVDESIPAVTLVDLNQVVFTPGSPNGTWSSPSSTLLLPNLPIPPGTQPAEITGLAVAPGTHIALAASEFQVNGVSFAILKLPATAGSGAPAVVDWAGGLIANDPTGAAWQGGGDPHTLTAYTSPTTGRAIGLIPNSTPFGPTFVAQLDLQGILDVPRLPGTHNLDPTYDLVAHGLITFIEMPCSPTRLTSDPLNCGSCGHACPAAANAEASCVASTCRFVCHGGTADCNGNPADGCEATTATDPANCGACGKRCAAPNAAGTCNAGSCTLRCTPGFSDCDGIAANGCETTGACASPTLTASGPGTVEVGAAPTYVATATEPAPGRTLAFAWTSLSGPAPVVFSSPSALTTTAQFLAPGTYVLQIEGNDGFTTVSASLTVTASYVNRPPVVTASADQTLAPPTMTARLSGSATDDGLPLGAKLAATWSLVSGPASVTLATPTTSGVAEPGPITAATNVTFAYPGTYVFELAVTDGVLVTTANETVVVNAPAAPPGPGGSAPTAPTVAFTGITDDALVTKPTAVLATISDGDWLLERRLGGRDDVETSWQTMASGAGAVSGTSLATFDPTLLLNGIYTLRLSATNSAGSTQQSVSVSVDGRMKVGNFTLAFTDLEVALSGLPFTLTRVYDSRDKTLGDFGIGWKLGLTDVRVEKSGKIGAYWVQQVNDLGVQNQFCLYPSQAASVALTFPSGRQYRFVAKASPECTLQQANPAPDIVWTSTSDPDSPTLKLVAANDSAVIARDAGNGVIQLQDPSFDIWDPRQFTLTLEDGTVYAIDQDLGVTQITDRGGEQLNVTPGGIFHSSGKKVTFARDTSHRITSITDPAGQAMTYAYDGNGDLTSFTDRSLAITQFGYSANHYLDVIQDPLGRQAIRNDYDAAGRLLSSTDALGQKVTYGHSLAQNQEQVTDRLGHVTLYEYNDRGDITKKTDATGAVRSYTFDVRGNKLTETDPLGRTSSMTYDGANDLLTQTDALGNVTVQTYNQFQQLVTTTDPLGHVTTNEWDGSNLKSRTDSLGNVTRYTYDESRWPGQPLTETDPLGNVTTNVYDDAGHVIARTDPLGVETDSTYDANGKKTSEGAFRTSLNGSGAFVMTSYQYDAMERLLQTQKNILSKPTRTTTYTLTGKVATRTDEVGRVTAYAYDALDRLVTTTRPDGMTETATYDAENRRLSSTDASGNTTLYAYDGVGRLVRTTFADGSSTSTVYDAAGQQTQSIDERGRVSWTSYDAAGRTASTTDPTGAVMQYAYDAAGNQVSMTDALGRTTQYAYDAANRRVATTYADGTADSTRYDADGRMIAKTDTLGRSTGYGYDNRGQLVRVVDALGNVTSYTYDETGAKRSQHDANRHVTQFDYDLATGLQIARFLPDGSMESRTGDAAGQVLARTDFIGRTTRYGYDPMGRVATRSYPDASVVSFTYTPTGQRATATDARGTTSYAYDSRNRLAQMTYPDGRALAYGYDAASERTRLTAKLGATSLTTTTTYDAAGRVSSVSDPLGRTTSLGYDRAGERTSLAYPNGTSTAYAYDARGRVTSINAIAGASTVASFGYVMDAAGNRTRIDEAGGTTRTYGYDLTDKLTNETVTGSLSYAKTFAYDPVGNRLTQTTTGAGAGDVSYTYDSRDRLTLENATSYAYDANGNVTSKAGEATYAWDFESRLVSVTMSDGSVVSHVYDVDGNRVKTSVTPSAGGGAPTVTNMLVDTGSGPSHVVAETDSGGAVSALYVRAGDELLAVVRPAPGPTWSTRYVHHDALGSVRALTDEAAVLSDTRGYEAFGTTNAEAGTDPLPYRFAGEAFEGTSKLAYHRARWMDPRVGRFHGMDPFSGHPEVPQTLHRYQYAWANPVNALDPSGQAVPDALLFGTAVHEELYTHFLAAPKLQPGISYANRAVSTLAGTHVSMEANLWTKIAYGSSFLARPDLAFKPDFGLGSGTGYIFEIKPENLEGEAAAEVRTYLYLLSVLDQRTIWREGDASDYSPPPQIVVGDIWVTIRISQPGVIVYSTLEGKVVQALAAITGIAALGVATLVGNTALAAEDAL